MQPSTLARWRVAIAGLWLCGGQLLACKIEPFAGPFSCKHGAACPPGQACGDNDVCEPQETCETTADCRPDYKCEAALCVKASKVEMSGGTGGSSSDSGSDAAVDSGRPDASELCDQDTRRCVDNTPARCSDGQWQLLDACGGTTPVCTNGQCATLKLYGGIVTAAGVAAEGSSIRVVEQGLEYTRLSCADTAQDGTVCLSGGIVP